MLDKVVGFTGQVVDASINGMADSICKKTKAPKFVKGAIKGAAYTTGISVVSFITGAAVIPIGGAAIIGAVVGSLISDSIVDDK